MNIIGKANYSPESTTQKPLKSSMTDPSDDFRLSYRVITRSGSTAALNTFAAISSGDERKAELICCLISGVFSSQFGHKQLKFLL
jgi:hypothetical protein